jgi:hypothetical protein
MSSKDTCMIHDKVHYQFCSAYANQAAQRKICCQQDMPFLSCDVISLTRSAMLCIHACAFMHIDPYWYLCVRMPNLKMNWMHSGKATTAKRVLTRFPYARDVPSSGEKQERSSCRLRSNSLFVAFRWYTAHFSKTRLVQENEEKAIACWSDFNSTLWQARRKDHGRRILRRTLK